jgi:hypothetical protein
MGVRACSLVTLLPEQACLCCRCAWRWQQTVNGMQQSVFYPLAYNSWEVNFYATPDTDINVKNGIISDGSNTYTRSNNLHTP